MNDPFIEATNAVAVLAQQRDEALRERDEALARAHHKSELAAEHWATLERLRAAPQLPDVGPVTHEDSFYDVGSMAWLDGEDYEAAEQKYLHRLACVRAILAFKDAEAAAPDPDTSLVTFGARDEGTGMVMLQHEDLPGDCYYEVHETAKWHRQIVANLGVTSSAGAAHAALAKVRKALNTAEAVGVDVDDRSSIGRALCDLCGPSGSDDTTIPTWMRACRYLAREVQALVDQGLRGDDLNARLPYEVRDHRTPVEVAAPDNEDEVQAFLGAIHEVGYGDAEPSDAIRLIEALDAHRAARSAEGGVTK